MDEKVYEKAVKLLAMRLHTTGELQKKLKIRGFKDADILLVLRRLEDLNFLDDLRFAQIFIENLKRYKDFGYFGIKTKLLARQIPSPMAEEALREFFTPDEELAVATRLLKKYAKKTYEQKARALSSRGFRSEIIHGAFRASA